MIAALYRGRRGRVLSIRSKLKKIFVESLKLFGVIFLVLILIFFSVLFDFDIRLTQSLCSLIFISYLTIKMLQIASWFNETREIRKLNKSKNSQEVQNINLYQLLGKGEADCNYFFNILNAPIDKDLLESLKDVRKKIKSEVGPTIGNYYLLRNYIEVYEKNNLLDKFSNIFLGMIIAMITALFSKVITSENVLVKFNEYFLNNDFGKEKDTIVSLSWIFDIGTLVIVITSIILYCIREFTKDKYRLQVIKSILDTIIKEEEIKREK